MFKLFPLVSDHAIRIINCFKNKKSTILKSIENSWKTRIREISFCNFFWKNWLCRQGGQAGQILVWKAPHDNYSSAKKEDWKVYRIVIRIIQSYGLQNCDDIFKSKLTFVALNCKRYLAFKWYYLLHTAYNDTSRLWYV